MRLGYKGCRCSFLHINSKAACCLSHTCPLGSCLWSQCSIKVWEGQRRDDPEMKGTMRQSGETLDGVRGCPLCPSHLLIPKQEPLAPAGWGHSRWAFTVHTALARHCGPRANGLKLFLTLFFNRQWKHNSEYKLENTDKQREEMYYTYIFCYVCFQG